MNKELGDCSALLLNCTLTHMDPFPDLLPAQFL